MNIQTSQVLPKALKSRPTQAKSSPEAEGTSSVIGDIIIGEPLVFGGLAGTSAYVAASAYPSTWAHEMGHAFAIDKLYTNSQPSVEVFPFEGGVTRWRPSELTPLGKKLGTDGTRALVSASGTLVDLGIATTTFGVGFKLRKKAPIVGHALMGYGAMTVLNSILYAGSAIGGDMAALAAQGNDFASLGVRAGLHPIASVAILASILPLEYAALKWLEGNEKEAIPEPNGTLARHG